MDNMNIYSEDEFIGEATSVELGDTDPDGRGLIQCGTAAMVDGSILDVIRRMPAGGKWGAWEI